MKFKKPLIALTLTAAAVAAVAAPTKKELAQKIVTLQQPAIESLALQMADQSAASLMQSASQVLQTQVAPEKRDAVAKAVRADLQKYLDEVRPLLRDKATKLAPTIFVPKLEESFTEDELQQIIAWLSSPVSKKYQQIQPALGDALGKQIATDLGPTIEPKLKALFQSVGKDLGVPTQAAPAATPAPAASPAPAKK